VHHLRHQTYRIHSGVRAGHVPEIKKSISTTNQPCQKRKQESRAAARKLRNAKAVRLCIKFANDIYYKLSCSQAMIKQGSSYKHIGTLCSMRCLVQLRRTGFHVTCYGRRPYDDVTFQYQTHHSLV